MRRGRSTVISRVVGMVCLFSLLLFSLTPIAAEASSPWVRVGESLKIDVPAGYGSFTDVDRWRAGVQIVVRVFRYPAAGRIRFASNGVILGEAADGGFTPQRSVQAGFRAFAWGRDAAGAARMWAPDLGALGSLLSVDPALPCADPPNATTPVAGPFTITIPAGAVPGGKVVPSPALASVFGNPARPAVLIRSANGTLLGKRSSASPHGGFLFADTIFAYGVAYGTPRLWTPVFNQRSTGLVETAFVGCSSTPPGTITLIEHLAPSDDPGLFDLQIDGETKAAAVGDQGSSGPIEVTDGEHSVSELASAGTDLGDYPVEITCTEDSNSASPLTVTGASLGQIPVAAGDDWRCDFTSTRADDTIDLDAIVVGSTPETDHASSKEIGPLGGSVEATSADGTRYSLSISPGALDSPTVITLTPTAVSGLDEIADATPAAVEFAPSGLTFAFPALLTITPAPGAPSVDFAATWEDGAPGVDVEFFTLGPDGFLVIEVPHFSGVGLIQATLQAYDKLLKSAIAQLPSYGGLNTQLANDFAGLPATSAAVAADVQAIFDASVKPLLDHAGDSLLQLQLADRNLLDFESLLASYDFFPNSIYDVEIDAGPPARTVADLKVDAVDAFIKKAKAFADSYMTVCNAPVASLIDWFAVPFAVVSELQVRAIDLPLTYCAFARMETLDWSNQIDETQTAVDGEIRGVIDAPAQTHGGEPKNGRMLFPQVTNFVLDAVDATWVSVSGGSSLTQQTGGDGVLELHLQRDPGTQSLTVDGTGQPIGLWAELNNLDPNIPAAIPVHLKASTGTISVSFRSPPTNVVLPFGQTTNLCVDVADGDGFALTSTPVDWTNDGPGLLAGTTSMTNSIGIACMDYHHPAGPVFQGDTDTITATVTSGPDTGRDAVTLTPQWAHVTIETRPDSQSPYTMTTNTTVNVSPGAHVQLRITVTESGATPADPPQPVCEACPITVRIENGGGELLDLSDNLTCVDCFVVLDANGQAELDWDPQGTNADTTILVTYPDLLFSQVPGVAATVTFTQQAPPGNVNGVIGGVDLTCDGDWCPVKQTYGGSFQLNVSASVYPGGGYLASVTGQLNWTVATEDELGVCGDVSRHSLTETFSGSASSGFVGFALDDPSVVELGVQFDGTYTGCNGAEPSGSGLLLRAVPVYQSGQLIGFDLNGATAFPDYRIRLCCGNSVTMTVSGFVPLT